jgi:hypothetical protein
MSRFAAIKETNMPLDIDSKIAASAIDTVEQVPKKTIFVLSGKDGEKIVIKADEVSEKHYKSVLPVINAIKPSARTILLDKNELSELNKYLPELTTVESTDISTKSDNVIFQEKPKELQGLEKLRYMLNHGCEFVKMPHYDMIDLDHALKQRLVDGNKTELRLFASTLSKPGGLEALGEVLAADLYIGNTDRFVPRAPDDDTVTSRKYGNVSFHFKALANIANVFCCKQEDGGGVVGPLDFVTSGGPQKRFDETLSKLEGTTDFGRWTGYALVKAEERKKFIAEVVEDLEKVLGPRRHKFSPFRKLPTNAAKRLEAGMMSGARHIRDAVGKHPGASQERYMLLKHAWLH